MTSSRPPDLESDEFWHDFLTRGQASERRARRLFTRIPSEPRCLLCAAPFSGPGARVMRLLGKRQSDQSPRMCNSCFAFMTKHHGGAEIEVTFLFADVRGSTSIAERMSPAAFRALMDRFYTTASRVVFAHDGGVDKFVGDELMAMFFPLLSGERHAARAVDAAVALLEATGHRDTGGPWLPLGAGVGTGMAWVGTVGEGSRTEMTALGDIVNTTARLSSAARAGEVLVAAGTAALAGVDEQFERLSLELKGKREPTEVVRVSVGSNVPV